MKPIEGKLHSPFQRKIWSIGINRPNKKELVWERSGATVNRVRASEGFPVFTFRELMDEVANVTLHNKSFEMYYRGQTFDYKNNQGKYYRDNVPKTIIFPTICRPEKKNEGGLKYSIRKNQIEKRYKNLERMIALVKNRKSYFDEYYYALFQHYDILPTPLVDITQSLRVATSFALRNSDTGYVYLFGLPYPNQSISYYSDLEIVLIKLQNVVPIKAIRPRYQEGFLVGKYPIRPNKTSGDDLSKRMIAKFKVDNSNGKFWDKYFQPMPEELLFPKNDEVELSLLKIKEEFQKKYLSK